MKGKFEKHGIRGIWLVIGVTLWFAVGSVRGQAAESKAGAFLPDCKGRLETSFVPTVRTITITQADWKQEPDEVLILVPGTRYSLLMRKGHVQPVFVDYEDKKEWTISGIEGIISQAQISSATQIGAEKERIRVSTIGGSTYWVWEFDFSSADIGLRVIFEDHGGW